eukprot:5199568-Pyramimonas_sp.AAC.1
MGGQMTRTPRTPPELRSPPGTVRLCDCVLLCHPTRPTPQRFQNRRLPEIRRFPRGLFAPRRLANTVILCYCATVLLYRSAG